MRIVEKILKIRRPVVFHFDEGNYGSMWTERDEPHYININLRLHRYLDPVRTYIHECVHVIFPKLSERNVHKVEHYVWEHLTQKERFLISRKLYSRRWRTK